MNAEKLCALIDERRSELFELLGALIRINSENERYGGKEKELAEYIHNRCLALGLESTMFSPLELEGFTEHPDYIPNHHLENRPNVTARLRGTSDTDELMLMAHMDTMPVGDLSRWEGDPLSGELRDGKIYGRGACDDKYALAVVLFLIGLFKEQGFTPKKNLLFAAYVDEEYGGSHGALAAVLKDPCPRIISMDGREHQIWHCGAGGGELIYSFHTAKAVDSAKAAVDALPIVLEEIEKFADARKAELGKNPYFAGTRIPDTALRYMGVRAGNSGSDLGTGIVHFVFYTDKTKREIDAELAVIDRAIKKRFLPLGIIGDGFTPNTRFFHHVCCAPDSEDVLLLSQSAVEATGKAPLVCGSCLSDLSVISKYGSSRAFAFGAGRDFSQIGGAHQPNEFIACDELLDYTKTIATYILHVLG